MSLATLLKRIFNKTITYITVGKTETLRGAVTNQIANKMQN